jgi:succinate dehydrogenase / fumarate reductase, membrane anchor subunit
MSLKSLRNIFYSLSSSEHGLQHWLLQKVTAVLLIPLSLLFVYFFSSVFGAGHEAVILYFQNDIIAFLTAFFLIISFLHLKQGLQVVIEDYVHGVLLNVWLLRIITWSTWILLMVSIIALGKIALSG